MLPEEIEARASDGAWMGLRAPVLKAYADFFVAVAWAKEAAEDVAREYITSPDDDVPRDWKDWDQVVLTLRLAAQSARLKTTDNMRSWDQRRDIMENMMNPFEVAANRLAEARIRVEQELMEEGGDDMEGME